MTRVLVIDDDASIREVVALALGDARYQVDTASDGHAALNLIGQQDPDLILFDMKTPGVDGWEFVKLYQQRFDRQAPIIVLTAAQDAARWGADVRADGYLAKPFDLDMLLDRVAAIVKKIGASSPHPPAPLSLDEGEGGR